MILVYWKTLRIFFSFFFPFRVAQRHFWRLVRSIDNERSAMRRLTGNFLFDFDAQGSWGGRGGGGGGVVVGSPGVGGTSNSSSSSSGASWRSGTPSPPLSDEGAPTTGSLWPTPAHVSHNQPHYPCNLSGSSSSSTPGSTITMDEGIVPDYLEEQHPRKKKIRAKVERDPIDSGPGSCATFESEQVSRSCWYRSSFAFYPSQEARSRGTIRQAVHERCVRS